jgi:hypothetical protein
MSVLLPIFSHSDTSRASARDGPLTFRHNDILFNNWKLKLDAVRRFRVFFRSEFCCAFVIFCLLTGTKSLPVHDFPFFADPWVFP